MGTAHGRDHLRRDTGPRPGAVRRTRILRGISRLYMCRHIFMLHLLTALTTACACIAAPGDVLTQGYNGYRTGAQLEENSLNVDNVSASTFGKVASLPVDGYVHVQPLVVNSLSMKSGTALDIVYIATGNN